jgi:DNA-binding transcriptional ArsR family regulator
MIDALACFGALSQKTRLAVVRLLVGAGPEGMAASAVAEALGVPPNTMSTHLKVLSHARLVSFSREGRVLRYSADLETLEALVVYLLEDCCGGQPELCDSIAALASRPGCRGG